MKEWFSTIYVIYNYDKEEREFPIVINTGKNKNLVLASVEKKRKSNKRFYSANYDRKEGGRKQTSVFRLR